MQAVLNLEVATDRKGDGAEARSCPTYPALGDSG
jgi:hypothetical protein